MTNPLPKVPRLSLYALIAMAGVLSATSTPSHALVGNAAYWANASHVITQTESLAGKGIKGNVITTPTGGITSNDIFLSRSRLLAIGAISAAVVFYEMSQSSSHLDAVDAQLDANSGIARDPATGLVLNPPGTAYGQSVDAIGIRTKAKNSSGENVEAIVPQNTHINSLGKVGSPAPPPAEVPAEISTTSTYYWKHPITSVLIGPLTTRAEAHRAYLSAKGLNTNYLEDGTGAQIGSVKYGYGAVNYTTNYGVVLGGGRYYTTSQYLTATNESTQHISTVNRACPTGYTFKTGSNFQTCTVASTSLEDSICLISKDSSGNFTGNPFDPDCAYLTLEQIYIGPGEISFKGADDSIINILDTPTTRTIDTKAPGLIPGTVRERSGELPAPAPASGPINKEKDGHKEGTVPSVPSPGSLQPPNAPIPKVETVNPATCGSFFNPCHSVSDTALTTTETHDDSNDISAGRAELDTANDSDGVLASFLSFKNFTIPSTPVTCSAGLSVPSAKDFELPIIGTTLDFDPAGVCPLIEPHEDAIKNMFLIGWTILSIFAFFRLTN